MPSAARDLEQSFEALLRSVRHAATDVEQHIASKEGLALQAFAELNYDKQTWSSRRSDLEEHRNELRRELEACDRQLEETRQLEASLGGPRRSLFGCCSGPLSASGTDTEFNVGAAAAPGRDLRSVAALLVSGAGAPQVNGRYVALEQGGEICFVKEGQEDLCIQWCEEAPERSAPASWQLQDSYAGRTFYFCPCRDREPFPQTNWQAFVGPDIFGVAHPVPAEPPPRVEVVAH